MFQHAAARRRLGELALGIKNINRFNTQPPEGGWAPMLVFHNPIVCFNTQPPEGGWITIGENGKAQAGFNTQPPEGGWAIGMLGGNELPEEVSTRSRPKAAGASLKSLAPSGFAALISLSSQEKREREYNTAFSVTPAFAIS